MSNIQNSKMHNPPHPGEILQELYLSPSNISKDSLAKRLGVARATISRIVNGRTSISVDMAIRLAKVFATTPQLWLNMQNQHDIWQASNNDIDDISKIVPYKPEELGINSTGLSNL